MQHIHNKGNHKQRPTSTSASPPTSTTFPKNINSPQKRPKRNRRLQHLTESRPPTIRPAYHRRQCDEPREPKQCRQAIDTCDGEFVRQAGGKTGRELEVEVCEEGPDGGEEEEVDLGGGGVVDVVIAVGVAVEEVVGVVDG
jgi:hypothetical protein